MALTSIAVLLTILPRVIRATCYWQNSTLAPDSQYSIAADDTACFPDQDNSPCCGTGWTCLSDGVCYIEQSGNPFYYRGTCTDRTWDSQQCPGWCFAQNANSSIPMIKCTNTEQDWYCCPGDDNCDCDTGKYAVKLGTTQPTTVTVIGSTSWPGIQSTTSPFTAQPLNTQGTTTHSDAAAAATSSSSGASSSPSTTRQTTGSNAGTAAASATGSGTTIIASNKSGGGSDTALAAGLGAGLGAAAVLIGLLVFFLIRSRRRKNRASVVPEMKDQGPYYSSQTDTGSTYVQDQQTPHQQWYDPPKQPGEEPSKAEFAPMSELGSGSEHERAEIMTSEASKNGVHHRAELMG